ncbi:type VII secretion-associated serine protease mycosin [Hamadaea flava]|uniref:Type VII secretion-associated serine protease mycosin n=1 Tax=Hamadaea flava TaxID=1742688 RepID=A0ABV8LPF9_9ACTN|nr:type VII secretion-associated serine protease mycosin [Hamadaea flava]MCP2323137.1 type VII secretion-associated serine protease mycosin [Hamadaea flava]
MKARLAAVVLAVTALTAVQLIGVAPARAVPPAGACHDPDPGRAPVRELPWAQKLLDPQRVWPFSRGAGVLVAVVDSGVDADHPQLRGRVRAGKDFFTTRNRPATFDCVSHGTAVAGIVAAAQVPGVGFHGVAPDAAILPVRISDRDVDDRGETLRIDPQILANGIRYAADAGAKVLNLSLAGYDDYPAVRAAVAYAVAKDVLVVAAAGNGQQSGGAEWPSFPAAYDGVLGVGAIDIDGALMSGSRTGQYVDIVAPGVKVLAPTRVTGHAYVDGTSFAAPFVAGTAALVRAAWPALTAAQVAQRLIATANPARGGLHSTRYGAGLVDPYRAVTDGLDLRGPGELPAFVPDPPDEARIAEAARQHRVATVAKWLTGAAVGGVGLAFVAALVLPRGRRRRWQAGWAAPSPVEPEIVEPPEQTFLI